MKSLSAPVYTAKSTSSKNDCEVAEQPLLLGEPPGGTPMSVAWGAPPLLLQLKAKWLQGHSSTLSPSYLSD